MAFNNSQCASCILGMTYKGMTHKGLVVQDMEEAAAKLTGSIDASRQDKSQLLSDIVETEKQVGPSLLLLVPLQFAVKTWPGASVLPSNTNAGLPVGFALHLCFAEWHHAD